MEHVRKAVVYQMSWDHYIRQMQEAERMLHKLREQWVAEGFVYNDATDAWEAPEAPQAWLEG